MLYTLLSVNRNKVNTNKEDGRGFAITRILSVSVDQKYLKTGWSRFSFIPCLSLASYDDLYSIKLISKHITS